MDTQKKSVIAGLSRDGKIVVTAFIVYLLSVIGCLISKLVIKDDYILTCVIIVIGTILYSLILLGVKCDNDETKNRSILIYSGIIKSIFLFGSTFENKLYSIEAMNASDDPLLYVAFIIAPILIGVELYLFIKNKKSEFLRKYVMISFSVVFILVVLNINSYWVFLIAIPVLASYAQFEDINLIKKGSIAIISIAICGAIRQLYYAETGIFDGSPLGIAIAAKHLIISKPSLDMAYLRSKYFIIILVLMAYCFVMVRITKSIKDENAEKIKLIETEQSKIEKLTDKVIEIGMKVKTSAFNTNNIITELDKAMKKTSDNIKELEKENANNKYVIGKQTQMNENITGLIKELKDDVSKANNSAEKSIERLNKSKNSFNELREKSNKMYSNNTEVIKVIDEFVRTSNEVKKITSGIAEISDETTLLSINASIKAVRAGEAGKGFSVIANRVRSLADETGNLTNSIDNLVEKLQNSAFMSQESISKVVDAIERENETIDTTIVDFKNMSENIENLNKNVYEINSSVNNITSFNSEIDKHILQLDELGETIGNRTLEVETVNEDNKNYIKATKDLMNKMLVTADKLDELYYMKDMNV